MSQARERIGLRMHPLLAEAKAVELLTHNVWYNILEDTSSIVEGFSLKRDRPGAVVKVLEAVSRGRVSGRVKEWAEERAREIEARRDPKREVVGIAFRFSPWIHQKNRIAFFESPGVALVANEKTGAVDVLVSGTRGHKGWVDSSRLNGAYCSVGEALVNRLSQAMENHRRIHPLIDLRLTQRTDGYRAVLLDQPDAVLFKGLSNAPIHPGVARIIG